MVTPYSEFLAKRAQFHEGAGFDPAAIPDHLFPFQDDVRLDNVLPFREARGEEDEKHVHPLQLDVIQRCLVLWSNPGERVFTPFMGVGSEVFEAVRGGRFGIGVELKPSYYRQAIKNLAALDRQQYESSSLFDGLLPVA